MRKLPISLAGSVLLILLFLVLFGDQFLQALVTKPELAHSPTLVMTPVPRNISAGDAAAASIQLSRWGYTMERSLTTRIRA